MPTPVIKSGKVHGENSKDFSVRCYKQGRHQQIDSIYLREGMT